MQSCIAWSLMSCRGQDARGRSRRTFALEDRDRSGHAEGLVDHGLEIYESSTVSVRFKNKREAPGRRTGWRRGQVLVRQLSRAAVGLEDLIVKLILDMRILRQVSNDLRARWVSTLSEMEERAPSAALLTQARVLAVVSSPAKRKVMISSLSSLIVRGLPPSSSSLEMMLSSRHDSCPPDRTLARLAATLSRMKALMNRSALRNSEEVQRWRLTLRYGKGD